MSLLSPKICGKEVLNAGAACTAGNATLPTEEGGQDNVHCVTVSQVDLPMQSVSWKPKMPFAWFTVTHF